MTPGDQLRVQVVKERQRGNVWKFNGTATGGRRRRGRSHLCGHDHGRVPLDSADRDERPPLNVDGAVPRSSPPWTRPCCWTAGAPQTPCIRRPSCIRAQYRRRMRWSDLVHRGAGCGPGIGVRLVSHVAVDGHTIIGRDAVLYPFCTVGFPPQDLKYKGEPTDTVIGPRTQIREHCTIHRGTVTGTGVTRVGADCLLMAVVHVAHDCEIGDSVIVAKTSSWAAMSGSANTR